MRESKTGNLQEMDKKAPAYLLRPIEDLYICKKI